MSDHLRIDSTVTTISHDLSSASVDLRRARLSLRLPSALPEGAADDLLGAHVALDRRVRRLDRSSDALAGVVARSARSLARTDGSIDALFTPLLHGLEPLEGSRVGPAGGSGSRVAGR
jgi:hypothetical protein